MNELNKNTLVAAISRLPVYEPPGQMWGSLDAALEANSRLAEIVRQLPTQQPPADIWQHIQEKLPPARPRTRRLSMWSRYAVAAMIAFLFGAWWLLRPGTVAQEQVVITQEKMDSEVTAAIQENDDVAFEQVQHLCSTGAPVCTQPEFLTLKSELDELTAAKEELHTALGQYGDDPQLAAQLVQIELARTQLLQEMIQMI